MSSACGADIDVVAGCGPACPLPCRRRRHSERPGCHGSEQALSSARGAFLDLQALQGLEGGDSGSGGGREGGGSGDRGWAAAELCAAAEAAAPYFGGLGPQCPLVARKFKDSTVK